MRKNIYVFESFVHDDAKREVCGVMDTGWIGLGKKVDEFERKFSEFVGSEYAVATSSATSALHMVLILMGVESSYNQIITTPMTFISVNEMILVSNNIPVFCDIDKNTGNITLDNIKLVRGKTNIGGAMLTHYAGNVIKYDDVLEIHKLFNGLIVNDFSHCCGAMYENGNLLGKLGDLNVFSFHAVKNLASPDGGMLVTNNKDIYDGAKKLRWCGIDKSTSDRFKDGYSPFYDIESIGYKYHMNDITAAMCLGHLKHLDESNRFRYEVMSKYLIGLDKSIEIIPFTKFSSCHMAVVKLPEFIDRDKFVSDLALDYKIFCGIHYYPNNQYDLFRYYGFPTPVTEKFSESIVTLPCHLKLSDDDVNYIINSINELMEINRNKTDI